MVINYHKMSGEELKRIYDVSGLNGEDFAEKLGVSRGKLYMQFKQKTVDEDLQLKILTDPDISKNRQLFKVLDNSAQEETPANNFYPGGELMAKALEMINESLLLTKDALITIRDDNQHIKKTSDFFQRILEKAHNEGNLVMLKGKSSQK